MARMAIQRGRKQYQKLAANAPVLSADNALSHNAYFAFVFVGAWLGTGKRLSPEDMGQVMTDVLLMLKPYFRFIDLNKDPGFWNRSMRKYQIWCRKGGFRKNPETWRVHLNERKNRGGSYYFFTSCPICSYLNRIGLGEIMKPLCETDHTMFALQHGRLHRKHTISSGGTVCDYWVVGDKLTDGKMK